MRKGQRSVMNYSAVFRMLGYVLQFEAGFLLLPCIVALIYREKSGFAYLIMAAACFVIGFGLSRIKGKSKNFFAKEGFVSVALSWIVMSLAGCMPFIISGEIPKFIDALFETVSGFTTTGASILTNVEALSKCSLFWRSFTHFVGGMGVLVFLLAILPLAGGQNMHLMRAESPGPQVGKLVPKIRSTALILYAIYAGMTVLQLVLMLCGKMPFFDAIAIAFGTAGTGGFAVTNAGLGGYSYYIQTVVAVFMILFGVNFNVYYLFLIRKTKQALKSEEVRWYFGLVIVSVILITWNTRGMYESTYDSAHHAFFQVATLISSTGFATTNFDLWPTASKTILILLMFCGACAGSTGGGLKVSRVVILLKSVMQEIKTLLHPRTVKQTRIEGKALEPAVRSSVQVFFFAYLLVFAGSLLLIAFDGYDFETSFTAVLATMSNMGPGMGAVGPMCNYSEFSVMAKYVMIFDMLAGRLELFPMLLLFVPETWKR